MAVMAAKAATTNGFKPVEQFQSHKRILIAIDGLEKSGKTEFALSAPAPIYYLNLDSGLEGVIEKYKGLKEIHVSDYSEDVEEIGDIPQQDGKRRQDAAKSVVNGVIRDFRYALKNGARTIAIDTGTEFWALLRLAEFGRLEKVPSLMHVEVNRVYHGLLRSVYDSESNLVLLHQVEEEWGDTERVDGNGQKKTVRQPTGRWVRDGFKKTGFLLQVEAQTRKDRCVCVKRHGGPCMKGSCKCAKPCGMDGEFHFTIQSCRHNTALEGEDFIGDSIKFPTIAPLIMTDTTEEDWQ